MKMKKIFSLASAWTVLALPLFSFTIAGSGAVAAQISPRSLNLSRLRDGHHQVCMQLPSKGLTCLWFQKKGRQITGTYFYPRTESGICINGRVATKNNTILGIATQDLHEGADAPELSPAEIAKLPSNQFVNWINTPENKIQLAQAQYLGNYQAKYNVAKLSLANRLYYVSQTQPGKIAMPKWQSNGQLLGWDYETPGQLASSCLKS
jgi:hypothetical protein